jgi:hypothetical protein
LAFYMPGNVKIRKLIHSGLHQTGSLTQPSCLGRAPWRRGYHAPPPTAYA